MKLSLLTPRDTDTNISFTLSFTVSFGPPTKINCSHNGNEFFSQYDSVFASPVVSREVIRSHYINSSYPDMTRVILTQTTSRESSTYSCTVNVTSRIGISTDSWSDAPENSVGTSTASITGECCTLLTTSPPPPPPLSCKPSHCCYGQQNWYQYSSVLVSWSAPSSPVMRCSPGSWFSEGATLS